MIDSHSDYSMHLLQAVNGFELPGVDGKTARRDVSDPRLLYKIMAEPGQMLTQSTDLHQATHFIVGRAEPILDSYAVLEESEVFDQLSDDKELPVNRIIEDGPDSMESGAEVIEESK